MQTIMDSIHSTYLQFEGKRINSQTNDVSVIVTCEIGHRSEQNSNLQIILAVKLIRISRFVQEMFCYMLRHYIAHL
jgi:hypothetical protein